MKQCRLADLAGYTTPKYLHISNGFKDIFSTNELHCEIKFNPNLPYFSKQLSRVIKVLN